MTYRSASRQVHFRHRTGSSSQTGFGNAWAEGGDPIEILPNVKEQYEHYKLIARQCRNALETNQGQEREASRIKLADAIRNIGDLRRLLQDGSRLAFEKVFVSVANRRLPKNTFLVLTEEAREIWRSEGYADLLPAMSKKERKLADKRETRRALIAAGAEFEA